MTRGKAISASGGVVDIEISNGDDEAFNQTVCHWFDLNNSWWDCDFCLRRCNRTRDRAFQLSSV
jgi:hypothetical protein